MKRRTAATRMTNCNVVMVGQQGLQAPPTEEGHGPARTRTIDAELCVFNRESMSAV